jgi:hypothetical protein
MISKGIEMQWKRVSCLHTIHGVGCGGSWFIVVHVDHLMQLWVGASDSNHWIKVMFVCVCFTWILHMLNNSCRERTHKLCTPLIAECVSFLIILERHVISSFDMWLVTYRIMKAFTRDEAAFQMGWTDQCFIPCKGMILCCKGINIGSSLIPLPFWVFCGSL